MEPPRKEPPGPTLGDLDWSAVLDPKPKKVASQPPPPPASPPSPLSKTNHLERGKALCAGPVGKDGRVLLVVNRRLVKSKKVEAGLRILLAEGVDVEIDGGDPPTVIRALES